MKYSRIKKNEQFNRIFKKGKKVFSRDVTIVYRPSSRLEMGVAVSKKHGGAVKRNRIKRLLRQAFYNTSDLFEGAYSVIIIPKVAEEYSLKQFEESISTCIKKVNSCKGK